MTFVRQALRTTIATLATLALLAGFLVTCPCSEAAASQHACCPPTTAMRAADDGCCLTTDATSPTVVAAPEPLLPGPVVAEVAHPLARVSLTATPSVRLAPPAPSPPRVLRI